MFAFMAAHSPQIIIVDDDPGMGQAIERLCGAVDMPARRFPSAEEFLASDAIDSASMLILDVNLPGLSGFELHDLLASRGIHLPVVFITGQDQPLSREKARMAGAAAYLTKPFRSGELLEALHSHLPAV